MALIIPVRVLVTRAFYLNNVRGDFERVSFSFKRNLRDWWLSRCEFRLVVTENVKTTSSFSRLKLALYKSVSWVSIQYL